VKTITDERFLAMFSGGRPGHQGSSASEGRPSLHIPCPVCQRGWVPWSAGGEPRGGALLGSALQAGEGQPYLSFARNRQWVRQLPCQLGFSLTAP